MIPFSKWWISKWEQRYRIEYERAQYWHSYRAMALEAIRNQQAPERGVRRLVNKVKWLQRELKRFKQSEVE
jgi:hypothetical protein